MTCVFPNIMVFWWKHLWAFPNRNVFFDQWCIQQKLYATNHGQMKQPWDFLTSECNQLRALNCFAFISRTWSYSDGWLDCQRQEIARVLFVVNFCKMPILLFPEVTMLLWVQCSVLEVKDSGELNFPCSSAQKMVRGPQEEKQCRFASITFLVCYCYS